ncbi:UNVERIFIED_CONTAM: hypothetical protein Sradi_1196600 [Sesamum radiatum]|uniref:Protein yippee-like n=1 Tax=Sesamum radiatum TaxID=300843 RepID=A0AAW2UKY3_SESRA
MARTSLEKFDEEDPDYYMCKSCRTHIALAEDFNSIDAGTELTGAMFDKAVNLRVDGPVHHRQVAGKTVADIYCLNCDEKLGWIYVRIFILFPSQEESLLRFIRDSSVWFSILDPKEGG